MSGMDSRLRGNDGGGGFGAWDRLLLLPEVHEVHLEALRRPVGRKLRRRAVRPTLLFGPEPVEEAEVVVG